MRISIATGYSRNGTHFTAVQHPRVEVVSLHASRITEGSTKLYPHLKDLRLKMDFDWSGICDRDLDSLTSKVEWLKICQKDFVEAGFPVIDLSGDHRLSGNVYKKMVSRKSQLKTMSKRVFFMGCGFTGEGAFVSRLVCICPGLALDSCYELRLLSWTPLSIRGGLTGASSCIQPFCPCAR